MKNLFRAALTTMIVSLFLSYSYGSEKEKLNILWLVTEDMGPWISPFGDNTAETPNLSRLANEGVRYPNMFSPSGVCAPSRFAIATSIYPSSGGATHMRTHSNTDQTGLPKYEAVPPAAKKGRLLHDKQ